MTTTPTTVMGVDMCATSRSPDYRAVDDARTLVEAHLVHADIERLTRAKAQLPALLAEGRENVVRTESRNLAACEMLAAK